MLSYSRNVVDQRSGGGQIRGRSYDVAVMLTVHDLLDFGMLAATDGVCSEEDHHESGLPKKN